MQSSFLFSLGTAFGFLLLAWLYADMRKSRGRIGARPMLALAASCTALWCLSFPTLATLDGLVLGIVVLGAACWVKAQEASLSPSPLYRLFCRVF